MATSAYDVTSNNFRHEFPCKTRCQNDLRLRATSNPLYWSENTGKRVKMRYLSRLPLLGSRSKILSRGGVGLNAWILGNSTSVFFIGLRRALKECSRGRQLFKRKVQVRACSV